MRIDAGYYKGRPVIINRFRDLYCDAESHDFLGQLCVVEKICKSGLIQVRLFDNPKKTRSFAQYNVDLMN